MVQTFQFTARVHKEIKHALPYMTQNILKLNKQTSKKELLSVTVTKIIIYM